MPALHDSLRPPAAILFDVGNTLLDERSYNLVGGIRAVVGDDALSRTLASAFLARLADDFREHREPLLSAWLRDQVPSLASMPLEAIENAIWPVVVTLSPRIGARSVLERLARDGVPMAAVSNLPFTARVLTTEFDRHSLGNGLRFVLSSADAGARKPSPVIFAAAVERLGVPANETWFVGDTFAEDIVGAHGAGLQPIWLTSTTAPAAELHVPIVSSWEYFLELYTAARTRRHTR